LTIGLCRVAHRLTLPFSADGGEKSRAVDKKLTFRQIRPEQSG